MMNNSTFCCMSVQSLARFMGKFSLEMHLGGLGMKWKVNSNCSNCGFEGVFWDFDVVVDGRFGLIGCAQ